MRRLAVTVLTGVLLSACAVDEPLGPSTAAFSKGSPAHANAGGRKDVKVMTRNLYLGASLTPVIGARSLQEVVGNGTVAWSIAKASDISGRMQAVADEIADARPDLVGLQEVTLWRTQFPGDAHAGGVPATTVAYDFLELLLEALEARGEQYVVAASVTNFDAEVPTITPGDPRLTDVRLTDRDVILVRADLETRNPAGAQYETRIPLKLGGEAGLQVVIPRGWTSVEAKFRGEWFRFVNTHLEVESPTVFGQVQLAQADELRQLLAAESLPVILVGDINSDALGRTTPSYGLLRMAGGFADAWSDANPEDLGFTSGHVENLRNDVSAPTSRIDVVLYRKGSGLLTAQSATLVGGDPARRTAAGVWPSDHLGVIATIRLGDARFLP